MVQEPTFVPSGNTLDLILTSDTEIVWDVLVFDPLPGWVSALPSGS